MNVCIFCSANDLDEKYMQPARELARSLGAAGHTLVWGGSNYGVMKAVADGFQEAGAKIVGVTVERYAEFARKNADEMIIAKSLAERRTAMLTRADVVVMTVGGIGTLDETTEALELKKQGKYNKPVIVLNTAGFYDDLRRQFEKMAREGFLPLGNQEGIAQRTLDDFLRFVDTPDEVVQLVASAATTAPITDARV